MTPTSTSRVPKFNRIGLFTGLAFGFGMTLFSCSASSSSGAGSGGGVMKIISCSLACGGGAGGTQISCGLNLVAVNESLSVEFSQPVDLATVNKNTFQITDLTTGKSPSGSFVLDSGNPNRLIFRPQLTFDASGSPLFGFEDQHSYQVLLRGVNQDSGGGFISSIGGSKNTSRMFCTIAAGGIIDPVPGPPTVVAKVDVVSETDPQTGDVIEVQSQVATGGAFLVDVWAESNIQFTFNDVMNPAALVNPVTGQSATIGIVVDPDGDPLTTIDQVPLFGDFSIFVDEANLETIVTFIPSGGFPSAGTGALPRRIRVNLSTSIVDLGTNSLTNAGPFAFVPQVVVFDPVEIPVGGEQFTDVSFRDDGNTGALWGNGMLLRGPGGGSGRLGPMVVTVADSPVVLDTDNEVFDGFDVLPVGSVAFPPSATPPTTTVTDGIFEFTQMVVEPGAELRFIGSNPARVFARGLADIQNSALVDIRGQEPPAVFTTPSGHDSSLLAGGAGGIGAAGGGAGGDGGDRPDDTDASLLALSPGGTPNPGAVRDGAAGGGIGVIPGLVAGAGGLAWPASAPATSSDLTGFIPNNICTIGQTAGPGGGGGYSTSGTDGVAKLVNGVLYPTKPPGLLPPDSIGGDTTTLGLTSAVRTLDPNQGFLRGGSGGGGGGQGFLRSQTDGDLFGECVIGKKFLVYTPNSGAGGGGGGGALQLQAGSLISINGTILSDGGRGGSGQNAPISNNREDQAAPGGGGSGGAVLLQSAELQIGNLAGRISVTGGLGGLGVGDNGGSKAGSGGLGLVRLEASVAPSAFVQAPKIQPFDAAPGSASGGDISSTILSTGQFTPGVSGPEGRSGAQSCWLVPQGNFFNLNFQEDDFSDPLNPVLGWDADVLTTTPGAQPFSLRDTNDPNNPFGVAPEVLLGSDLGGVSPGTIVIRFQGVRATKAVTDVCNVNLEDPLGEVDVSSLTAWVRHPAALNGYWDLVLPGQPELAAKRRSNMIRYQVIFDGDGPSSSLITGITNLVIRGLPD